MYVSTAYSNCVRKSIDEKLYPAPITYDIIMKLVGDAEKNNWSEKEMENLTTRYAASYCLIVTSGNWTSINLFEV